jgi:hypothetical protein
MPGLYPLSTLALGGICVDEKHPPLIIIQRVKMKIIFYKCLNTIELSQAHMKEV